MKNLPKVLKYIDPTSSFGPSLPSFRHPSSFIPASLFVIPASLFVIPASLFVIPASLFVIPAGEPESH